MEPLARRTGDLFRLHWVVFEGALVAVAAADWVGARERIGEALALTARSGYPAHEIWQRAHLGWIARLQGDHATAVRHGRRAVELAEQAGHHWWLPSARALLAGTLLECGGHDEAVTLLADVVARARQDGMQAHRLRCLAPLAEATGDPAVLAEADALLRGIDAPPGAAWLTGFDVYIAVARAWLNAGEPGGPGTCSRRCSPRPRAQAGCRCWPPRAWRTGVPRPDSGRGTWHAWRCAGRTTWPASTGCRTVRGGAPMRSPT